MKKQNALTVFYVLYFMWLFAVVFLSRTQEILGYFVVIVLLFYFIFLREKWDLLVFSATVCLYYLLNIVSYNSNTLSYNFGVLSLDSVWVPLTWGTTILALKKFYSVATVIH